MTAHGENGRRRASSELRVRASHQSRLPLFRMPKQRILSNSKGSKVAFALPTSKTGTLKNLRQKVTRSRHD